MDNCVEFSIENERKPNLVKRGTYFSVTVRHSLGTESNRWIRLSAISDNEPNAMQQAWSTMNGKFVVCNWIVQIIEFVVLSATCNVVRCANGSLQFVKRARFHSVNALKVVLSFHTYLFSHLKTIERHRKNWIIALKLEKLACKYPKRLRAVV